MLIYNFPALKELNIKNKVKYFSKYFNPASLRMCLFFSSKNYKYANVYPDILSPFRARNQRDIESPGWRRGLFISCHFVAFSS
jgi:hypothetical protein